MATGILTLPTLAERSSRATRRHPKGRKQDLFHVEHIDSLQLDAHSFQFDGSAVAQILPLLSTASPEHTTTLSSPSPLPPSSVSSPLTHPSPLLASSPYLVPAHLLDLTRLPDVQDRILALALTQLRPTRADYATAEYASSLAWADVRQSVALLADAAHHVWRSRTYYVVIFRSKLKQDFDAPLLWELDRESHREAVESGGLLKYWFGSTDANNRNLATCVWRSREDARAGGTGPWHRKARAAGAQLYEHITFSTWKLTISDDAEFLSFDDWAH